MESNQLEWKINYFNTMVSNVLFGGKHKNIDQKI